MVTTSIQHKGSLQAGSVDSNSSFPNLFKIARDYLGTFYTSARSLNEYFTFALYWDRTIGIASASKDFCH